MTNLREKSPWLSWGAVLPAVGFSLSWLCCLPIAASVLGVAAAALGAHLILLRPYLIALTVGLLGFAFYRAYRPHEADCRDGAGPAGSCAVADGRHRKWMLWAASLIALSLLTLPSWSSWLIYWTL